MRILYVVHQFHPQFASGTEQYVLALSRAGRARGDDVRVFTLNPDFRDNSRAGESEDYLFQGVPVTRYHFDKEKLGNTLLADYRHPGVGPPFRRLLDDFRPQAVHFFHFRWLGIDRLEEVRERAIPAVVHLMDFWFLCPLFILLKPWGRENCAGPGTGCFACVSRALGLRLEEAELPARVAELEAAGREPTGEADPLQEGLALVRRPRELAAALASADLVISPSATVRDVLAANGVEPPGLEIRPYAIDWNGLAGPGDPPPEPVTIGFMGSFAPHKGVDLLVRAFTGLEGDIRLRLHGRFGDFEDFDRELQELAAGDERIEFPGPFAREELPRVLAGLHALAVPSCWRENTPFVCLEARAAGLPLVAADLPGMAEAVPAGRGALFAPGDAGSLRAGLARTVREVEERGGRRLPPDLAIGSLPNQYAEFRRDYGRLAGVETPARPTLSVLVPAYNEKATLEEALARVKASPVDKEIIVVDDGSTDGTREILRRLEDGAGEIRVACHERNAGKGAAIRTAIGLAGGRIAIVQDADLEYDPQDYPALVAPILAGGTKVVYGSRPKCRENDYPLDLFRVGSLLMTVTASLLYTCRLSDEPTCYKVFDMELLKSINLRSRGFEFCPEVTAKVRKKGERIVEVPIRYRKRSVEEGKKIKARDLFVGLWTLLKYRFVD